MQSRTFITAGTIGAALAALCCATPLLALVLGAVGLTAWLTSLNYLVMPALILCLALIALGLYRSRMRKD